MNNYNSRNNNISRKVSYGGIVNLLTVVCLYLSSVLPTNRLLFFALSSVFLSVIVIEFGVKFAIVNYGSASILGFLIIFNKMILVPYIMFFGYYGVLKYYIERLDNLFLEIGIKLVVYNIAMYLIYLFASELLIGNIKVALPIWAIIILMEVIFIIYDHAFSIFISYYRHRLRKYIK